MKVKVLLENTKPENSNLCIGHGLSLLIKKDNKSILFDTGGPKGCVIQNASLLKEDLSKIDAVILSHGHNDHTGGLLKFFELNDNAQVYLKKEALNPFYSKKSSNRKFIGTDDKIAEDYLDRLKFVNTALEIIPDIFIVPKIHKKFSIPSSNRYLLTENENGILNDTFSHELFMIIKGENLAILSSCTHNGIKNIISTAKDIFPNMPVKTIIGGLHLQAGSSALLQAQDDEIYDIAEFLMNENVEKVFTGHCTGDKGFNILKSILKDRIERIYSGMEIFF
jgi:7,8-dihydropterin-6-yl-methyl-4-(beta-D-ribofuranosyl)aminobenzene 5'-phosphate synthase